MTAEFLDDLSVAEELDDGVLSFEPLPEQERFCRSKAKIVLALGGNGSGKTEVLCRLAGWEMMQGNRAGRLPVHGWCTRPSFSDDIKTDPIFAKMWFGDGGNLPIIPRAMQHGIYGNPRKRMELVNGSTLSIRTWNQGDQRQQGHSPDFILIDEECDEAFFTELCARMFRRERGWIGAAITDTKAPTWVIDLVERSERGDTNILVCRMNTRHNTYVNQNQVSFFAQCMEESERDVRIGGGLRITEGRVYTCWSDSNWRQREELPLDGTDYVFIDPGIANPCAALWVRVCKPERRKTIDGTEREVSDLWVFGEYYKARQSDVGQHVANIKAMNNSLLSFPAKYFIDPWASAQRISSIGSSVRTVLDVWKQAGLEVTPASTTREMYKLERFRATEHHIRLDDHAYPNLYAVKDMDNLSRELRKYFVTGMVDPPQRRGKKRREEFSGPNHLIFGMECACVMRINYMPRWTALTATKTQAQIIGDIAWERIGKKRSGPLVTSGDLGALVIR